MQKRIRKRYVALGVLVFVLAAFAAVHLLASGGAGGQGGGGLRPVSSDRFYGDFSLVSGDGTRFTEDDLTGRYALVYFGFTSCPAICPTELQKMTAALAQLDQPEGGILPVFITVDPERDTPDAVDSYVDSFADGMVGLSGSEDEIDAAKKAFKVYAAKVEDPALTEYTMNHTSYIYFLDPQGRLLHIFKTDDTATGMADTMQNWLAAAR